MREADEEEWRPVLGFEAGYEVSNKGRVRSKARSVNRGVRGTVHFPDRILKTWLAHGYPTVNLSLYGRRRNIPIHILICEAWHGPRPVGAFARHLDDVPTNLDPSNLAWGSPTDNAQDALRNGRNSWAKRTHCLNGHEYTSENTRWNKHGHRLCLTCTRKQWAKSRARIKAARTLAKEQGRS